MANPTSKLQINTTLLLLLLISSPLFVLSVSESQEKQIERTAAYIATSSPSSSSSSSSFSSNIGTNKAIRLRGIRKGINIREFLDEHNKVRQQIGEPPLKWDKNLTRYARRFASKRVENCDMVHSYGPYGENIYWGSDYYQHSAADAVRAWANEFRDYDPSTNVCAENKLCGHYKQIVWRSSERLGCARVRCLDGGVYIICSYDPPGNYINENPFGVVIDPAPTAPTTPISTQTPTTYTPISPPPPPPPTPTPTPTVTTTNSPSEQGV